MKFHVAVFILVLSIMFVFAAIFFGAMYIETAVNIPPKTLYTLGLICFILGIFGFLTLATTKEII